MKTGYFTICSRNYLAYALTLRDSLRAAEAGSDLTIFLADEPVQENAPHGVEIIPVSGLENADIVDMAFRYTVLEFNTAIKPLCFDHMFDRKGWDAVVYLDPDIRLMAPMQRVNEALGAGASCVLTPHICTPLRDAESPTDLDLMRSGTFNLGFAAFANVPEARAFLAWWGDKLRHHCRIDLQNGLFVDQRFVDFAPSFIDRLTVLRDPGYNVAYWNLANRPVCKEASGWTAGGQPLVFFHFSGVSPNRPEVFSKHQSRFGMTDIGDTAELLRDYLASLAANGQARWSTTPYAYGTFATGEPIASPMRRGPPADPAAPFAAPNHAYWNAPSERVDQSPGQTITRLMYAIHTDRADLQAQFPLSTAAGRRDFHAWFIVYGAAEHSCSETSVAAALSESAIRAPKFAANLARLRLGLGRITGRRARKSLWNSLK